MKKATIISLDRPGRLLKKTATYLTDMDVFLAELPGSVTILLDALPFADQPLTAKILPLLGTAGRDRALWPLFHLMMDSSADEGIRRSVAVHLGLAASLSDNPSRLNAELIDNLDHPDPSVRASCALALGWEGNAGAVAALLSHLQDPDGDVQAAMVAALSSLNDVRVFDRLVERLENGNLEERRSILLNLWRFAERIPEAERVYRDSLNWLPVDLFPDILSAVAMIPHTASVLGIYRRMLAEDNPGIRLQVLENMEVLDPLDYVSLNGLLQRLLVDKDARVRQAAIRLLARRGKGG